MTSGNSKAMRAASSTLTISGTLRPRRARARRASTPRATRLQSERLPGDEVAQRRGDDPGGERQEMRVEADEVARPRAARSDGIDGHLGHLLRITGETLTLLHDVVRPAIRRLVPRSTSPREVVSDLVGDAGGE